MTFSISDHKEGVTALKFSPNGKYLASCSADKTVKIWEVCNHGMFKSCIGHKLGVNSVVWFFDSERLVSASDDTTLRIWHIRVNGTLEILKGHTDKVLCCDLNIQSTLLLSGSTDKSIKMWQIYHDGYSCIKTISAAHSDIVTTINFSLDGTIFVSGSSDGTCHIWDSAKRRSYKTITDDEKHSVSLAKFSRCTKYLLVGTLKSIFKLWNFRESRWSKIRLIGHKNENLLCTANFLTERYVISGSEDFVIYIWDTKTGDIVQKLFGHIGMVKCIACHPLKNNNFLLASGTFGRDNSIKFWFLETESQ